MAPYPATTGPTVRARRGGEAGLTLIEIMIAVAIVAVGLLAHAATNLAGHRFNRLEESRSVALQTARQFLERMRTDADWAGVYASWRPLMASANPGHPPTTYYPGFVVPSILGPTTVRIDVPTTENLLDPFAGTFELREDADAPEFGLPYDLDGDGLIGPEPCNDTYRALPVIVHLQWQGAGEVPQEIRVHTWLRGER